MTDPEIDSLRQQLEEAFKPEEAWFAMNHAGKTSDDSVITANRAGYLALAAECLYAASSMPGEDGRVGADFKGYLTESSNIAFGTALRAKDRPEVTLPSTPIALGGYASVAAALGVATLALYGLSQALWHLFHW